MKTETIQLLTGTFEANAQQTESGIEYWLGRDLQHLLGYAEWRNFTAVIMKAKTACEVSGHPTSDHFVDVNKMVDLGSGSTREVEDVMLTRYACYLIAQNGDPQKHEIAFAQTYFAIQTRRAELIEQRILEAERVSARKKLTTTEKELSQVIFEQTGGNQDFALIRSKGDQALFGKSTQAMKAQWKVPDSRPLADFAPTIILKAKDFAAEITIFNARQHQLTTEPAISREHISNNDAVRRTLLERGIRPETPPARGRCQEGRAPPRLRRQEVAHESRTAGLTEIPKHHGQADAGFDVLIACAFNYEAHTTEFSKLGRIPVLKARMNADLHMADDLKNTGKGNLFVIFGEPDIEIMEADGGQVRVKVNGVDVFHPNTGQVRSDGAEGIACWFIDTDYNEESFFVRHAYFLGANDPYAALKTTLKAEINADAWESLHSDTSRPFAKPKGGRIAVKVINHLGDEVMKVFRL